MICASIAPRDERQAAELLRRARDEGADLAELRVDLMPPGANVPALLASKPLPVIVTIRPSWEGGAWEGPEDLRVMALRAAAQAGADYVDIEFKAYKDLPDLPARVIVSFHDFAGLPADLGALARKMELLKPAIVKIAASPRTTAETVELARHARGREALRCAIGMGEWGEPLRTLYGKLGGAMTYASLDADQATAPGQLTVRELRETFRADEVDEDWLVYAVVGNPVRHSRGPAIWNHAFRRLRERAVYARIPLDDPARLPDVASAFGVSGLSVTIPHKQAAMAHLDEVDEIADRIGAVNTIAIREGRRIGFNTDWQGIASALREACGRKFGAASLEGRKALVFGAGGTGRAALYALARSGANAIVANRDWDRASDLAQEMGARAVPLEAVADVVAPEIVVQATSVGMEPETGRSIVPASLLARGQVCLDAVYTPPRTRFLREAHAAGAEAVSGTEIFLRQAAAQFEIFFGRPLPDEILAEWRALV
jgi:3-dehydroquinate dehydratase/shikimate dehydrogenase